MDKQLKAQLPHTWRAFFAGHGSFTEVQRRAMPVILSGSDALVAAATASGKTEAALAPLLERRVLGGGAGLRLLYLCPTRALVRDLYGRLEPPFRALNVSLGMKSGDTGPVPTRRPPSVLLTTPESTDSLLTRAPRLFETLEAIILDEIHLFDDGPRGDQVRCLLERIETIRTWGRPERAPTQRVALSATVDAPGEVAARYLHDATVVQVAGNRALSAELFPVHSLDDVVAVLAARGTKKTLLFCNTRHEVEEVAAYLRRALPFEAAVLVHYSNLDTAMRHEVETRFAEASVAVCVSSSTLELGVDIGSIDEVALLGPPASLASFLQRVGRGGRRRGEARVVCGARSVLEWRQFEALLGMAHGQLPILPNGTYHFKLSVLVQQTFSLLKQSPTGGLRLADLRRSVPEALAASLSNDIIRHLLGYLSAEGYLTPGRPGEWRAGVGLNELADEHEIYSNIGGELLAATVVDAYSGRAIAQTDRPRMKGETLLMGGRPVEVVWRDRRTFAVKEGDRRMAKESLRLHTSPQALPLGTAQGIALTLGVPQGALPLVTAPRGVLLYHFWGDLYGEWLAAILRVYFSPADPADNDTGGALITPHSALSLLLTFSLPALPPWDEGVALDTLKELEPLFETWLELGRFHPLLPPDLALQSVREGCNLKRFEMLYRSARIISPTPELRAGLTELF